MSKKQFCHSNNMLRTNTAMSTMAYSHKSSKVPDQYYKGAKAKLNEMIPAQRRNVFKSKIKNNKNNKKLKCAKLEEKVRRQLKNISSWKMSNNKSSWKRRPKATLWYAIAPSQNVWRCIANVSGRATCVMTDVNAVNAITLRSTMMKYVQLEQESNQETQLHLVARNKNLRS